MAPGDVQSPQAELGYGLDAACHIPGIEKGVRRKNSWLVAGESGLAHGALQQLLTLLGPC